MGIIEDMEEFIEDPDDGDYIPTFCDAMDALKKIEAMLPDLESRPATKGVAHKLRAILWLPNPEEEPALCTGHMSANFERQYFECNRCSYILMKARHKEGPKHDVFFPLKGLYDHPLPRESTA